MNFMVVNILVAIGALILGSGICFLLFRYHAHSLQF